MLSLLLKYLLVFLLVLLTTEVGNPGFYERHIPDSEKINPVNSISVELNQIEIDNIVYTSQKIKPASKNVDAKLSSIVAKDFSGELNKPAGEIAHNQSGNIYEEQKENQINFIRIIFDNDIFDNTDYYYTNGAEIQITTTLATASPLRNLLPEFKKSKFQTEGFYIRQNIYTPINPDVSEIQFGDHPFSAFTAIGQFKESYSNNMRTYLKSSISFGVIGPASLGGKVQSGIHDIEPVGWQNQIQNDFYFNYNINLKTAVLNYKLFELNLLAKADAGTAFNNLGLGLNFRFGRFTPYLDNELLNFNKSSRQNLKFWIFAGLNYNLVLYNAVLQGGMFNSDSPYVINSSEINNMLIDASIGVNMSYGRFALQLENFWHSPEFIGARDFKYGRINLLIGLN